MSTILRFTIVFYELYLTNIFCNLYLRIISDNYFSYFVFSDPYITSSNTSRHRVSAFVKDHFSGGNEQASKANQSKSVDEYLNVQDDFKTNLMWLSIFVHSVEGVGMRLPVNYRTVLQTNYFEAGEKGKSIYDAVYDPDGDTFQNSPIKLVFFASYLHNRSGPETQFMTSISKVDVNASDAKLSKKQDFSNVTLEMKGIQCLWPREEDLKAFLYLLGYHPVNSMGNGIHDFPWNDILGLFNQQNMKDPDVLVHMLRHLSLGFLNDKNLTPQENLATFKDFIQYMTPIFSSAIEGNHRIELANRLLYGIALKEEAPFFKTKERSSEFREVPFNSTVHKPIQAVVYLQAENSSALGTPVITHLTKLSRKTAEQKTLYIRDNWRSLYLAIYTTLENDRLFETQLFKTQQELYWEPLEKRQKEDCKARKNRIRLGEVIADVIFAENPTAKLAAEAAKNQKEPITLAKWKDALNAKQWKVMDSNPFTAVR